MQKDVMHNSKENSIYCIITFGGNAQHEILYKYEFPIAKKVFYIAKKHVLAIKNIQFTFDDHHPKCFLWQSRTITISNWLFAIATYIV